jgi:hypothetical protein
MHRMEISSIDDQSPEALWQAAQQHAAALSQQPAAALPQHPDAALPQQPSAAIPQPLQVETAHHNVITEEQTRRWAIQKSRAQLIIKLGILPDTVQTCGHFQYRAFSCHVHTMLECVIFAIIENV